MSVRVLACVRACVRAYVCIMCVGVGGWLGVSVVSHICINVYAPLDHHNGNIEALEMPYM